MTERVRFSSGRARLAAGLLGAIAIALLLVLIRGALKGRDASAKTVSQSGVVDAEYAKLTSLSAGMYTARFADAMGIPVFLQVSKDGSRIEKTYAGPGYLVQTVENNVGTVQLMSVTSCRSDFNPSFTTPVGVVTLGTTTMGELKLAGEKQQPPSTPLYNIALATTNTTLYDEYYLGNPGNYVTYLVGLDDACPFQADIPVLVKALGIPKVEHITAADLSNPAVQTFRNGAVINTFAETAPTVTPSQALDGFQVGANRILVRTLPKSVQPTAP